MASSLCCPTGECLPQSGDVKKPFHLIPPPLLPSPNYPTLGTEGGSELEELLPFQCLWSILTPSGRFLPLTLPLCLCLRVCGGTKCANVIMKNSVYESVGLPCLYHMSKKKKRCLCASRRHLRALWESRVNDASMIFFFLQKCTLILHTHTSLLLFCFYLLLRSARKKRRKKNSPPVNSVVSFLL